MFFPLFVPTEGALASASCGIIGDMRNEKSRIRFAIRAYRASRTIKKGVKKLEKIKETAMLISEPVDHLEEAKHRGRVISKRGILHSEVDEGIRLARDRQGEILEIVRSLRSRKRD